MRAVLSCITSAATLAFVTDAVATALLFQEGQSQAILSSITRTGRLSGKYQMICVLGLEYRAWNTWNRLANG